MPKTTRLNGDVNGSGVCDSADVELFNDILADDTIDLSNGIDTDELAQLNALTNQDGDLTEWTEVFGQTVSESAGISDTQLTVLRDGITTAEESAAWSAEFEALGVDMPSTINLTDGVSWDELGEGIMTEECFNAVFDEDNNGTLSLTELQTAKAMLQEVATSGVMGTNSLADVFNEYADTNVFFTVDLEEYIASKDSLEALASAVGADSVWDLMKNLIESGIDIGYDPENQEVQEIYLGKLNAFKDTVNDLAASNVMGTTSVATAYDEYIEEGFTIDATELAAHQDNLQAYIDSDDRVSTVWDLLKELNGADYDIGLTTSNNIVDLDDVDTLVTEYLDSTVEGGGAGLIDRINANNPYGVSGLLFNAMETALRGNSLTTFETSVLESIGDVNDFRAVAGGANMTADKLDTIIDGMQPPPLF